MTAPARLVTKILLGLNILICVFIIYINGFSFSPGVINHSFQYGISLVAIVFLVYCLTFLWKKSTSLLLPLILFALLILLGLITLASLNCSSRCLPDTYRLRSAQAGIELYYRENGSYPDSLQQMGYESRGSGPAPIEYTQKGNSYQACMYKGIKYFYGFKINRGDLYCVSPGNTGSYIAK